ncbi:hypothetical protein [[Mycoplasma] gypis]|uniref:Uncharacterized protein n=1 Tax=[Mycoplasma] gypis TaxID=92404 RepID=A0ABZ2RMT6_9BACT|nr:hypothetical protein [[Mycoplasma] gypis]MBN0919511.1 hypothetical protein [[Mycoplasma] gypis]
MKRTQTYKVERVLGLSYHWRIALFGMLFVILPAMILYFAVGKDVDSVYRAYSHALAWWALLLIALLAFFVTIAITILFIRVFKWFGFEVFNFIIPFSLMMYSFLVTSGISWDLWFVRIITPAVLFITVVPTILINKKVAQKKLKIKKELDRIERQKNKSLLD